ncbi:translation initiation factor eIF-1A [Candidatus Woesearchaeota archaeon]|nr:translation initiation factor eIF-1A [Candidatus Woesearchaeota archaeon]
MSLKKQKLEEQQKIQEEIQRIKLPKGKQCLGMVQQRVGGSRMIVKCLDGRTRNCRIPGRMKRRLWVREGDIVIVEPWELCGEEKGDILFKYRPTQVAWLKQRGHLKAFEDLEEF